MGCGETLRSYDSLRSEVVTYAESRASMDHREGGGKGNVDRGDPMDCDTFVQTYGWHSRGRGGAGGKSFPFSDKGRRRGNGGAGAGRGFRAREARECFTCGRKGHMMADCWQGSGGAGGADKRGSGGASNSDEQSGGGGAKAPRARSPNMNLVGSMRSTSPIRNGMQAL